MSLSCIGKEHIAECPINQSVLVLAQELSTDLSIYHISKKFSLYFMSWKVCFSAYFATIHSVFMHTQLTVQFSTPSILGVQSTPTIQYMASSAFLTFASYISTYSSTYILHSFACSATSLVPRPLSEKLRRGLVTRPYSTLSQRNSISHATTRKRGQN